MREGEGAIGITLSYITNYSEITKQEFRGRRRRTCWGKVTGATIRPWLLNKFISFLAVLSWKTGLKNVDKVPSGTHIFQASAIPSNGYIFSTDFSYYTAQ